MEVVKAEPSLQGGPGLTNRASASTPLSYGQSRYRIVRATLRPKAFLLPYMRSFLDLWPSTSIFHAWICGWYRRTHEAEAEALTPRP
jgi:hypothetical protein